MVGHRKKSAGRETLASVVHRNIEALIAYEKDRENQRSFAHKLAVQVANAISTLTFAIAQIAFMIAWIAINAHLGERAWDPYPWSLLSLICGGEAILLATIVLAGQRRLGQLEEKRSNLDLQISLLSEHEVTRAITLLEAISDKIGVKIERRPETEELKKDVAPEAVLKAMEQAEEKDGKSPKK